MENPPNKTKTIAPFNETLRADLAAYQETRNLTNADLARELGFHYTQVSRYLNGKPDWNVDRLEAVAADVLKGAAMRQTELTDLFETSASRHVNATCEKIRKTNDVGALLAPAGTGKTCGVDLYLLANPASIKITVTEDACDGEGMVSLLFEAVETGAYDNRTKRSTWLKDKFRESNRLLIFDNAHLIKKRGWDWLFNFHDATGVPIALVGNPEMIHMLRTNDQWFSRVGIKAEIPLKDPAEAAMQLIKRFAGSAALDGLQDLSEQVVESKGRLRALKKQLKLARQIADDTGSDLAKAFRAAHLQLIRDFELQ